MDINNEIKISALFLCNYKKYWFSMIVEVNKLTKIYISLFANSLAFLIYRKKKFFKKRVTTTYYSSLILCVN